MELDAKELTNEEITNLISQLKTELRLREATAPQLVVYTHDCYQSANYHRNKYTHWCKMVKAIDDTKISGYAFLGDFLLPFAENKLALGSIVVEVCGIDYTAYTVTGDHEKERICTARRGSLSKMIAAIKEQLEKEDC
ncbi:hypothetical protein [Synergistes jonesii]|uniref:hypothetical protein n=1 Tax=Synergistes jonesii TaxID=2754 RepID=UPI00248EE066|nr:hypothetical protein [Synergistes jonesii]